MAYRIVLTEETAEIAVAKENGAGAVSADKGTLLAKMRTPARYKWLIPSLAKPHLI